jgi:hypothetical protein
VRTAVGRQTQVDLSVMIDALMRYERQVESETDQLRPFGQHWVSRRQQMIDRYVRMADLSQVFSGVMGLSVVNTGPTDTHGESGEKVSGKNTTKRMDCSLGVYWLVSFHS